MLTGLLDVPYRKSFALLEELLERREAEEQTLAISTLATQLKNATKYHSTICSFAPNRN